MDKMALYMQHWPGFLVNAYSNDSYLEGLIKCKEQGLADAIGVSNFNAQRLRGAARRLKQAGIPLASNQVHAWASGILEGNVRSKCELPEHVQSNPSSVYLLLCTAYISFTTLMMFW